MASGSVRILTQGQALVVDLLGATGQSVSAWSDAALTASLALPVTISSDTTIYVRPDDDLALSVKRNGLEIASEVGTTRAFRPQAGQQLVVSPSVNPGVEAAADTATFATVVGEAHTDTQVVNTAAETALCTFALPTDLTVGSILELEAWGDLLNNTGASANYIWRVKIGATAALTTGSTGVGANALPRRWALRAVILIESVTAQRVTGRLAVGTASAATWHAFSFGAEGAGSAAEDLAAGKNLTFTVQLGSAASTLDMTLKGAVLKRVGKTS